MSRNIDVRFLLDVNVLIALAFPKHIHHERVQSWFMEALDRRWATCPLTQGGFLRVAYYELGGSPNAMRTTVAALEQICQTSAHEFWPMDLDLRGLSDLQRSRLMGPKQIADLQLLLLAHRHGGQLATLDTGIRELATGGKYASSLLVI